jgi:hypothetical protein
VMVTVYAPAGVPFGLGVDVVLAGVDVALLELPAPHPRRSSPAAMTVNITLRCRRPSSVNADLLIRRRANKPANVANVIPGACIGASRNGTHASTRDVVVMVNDEVADPPFKFSVAGLKTHAAPAGRPEHVTVTWPLKPEMASTVTVLSAGCPAATVKLDGIAATLKSVPAPRREIACGLFVALSLIDKVADAVPAAAGLKRIARLQLALGLNVAAQSVVNENGPDGSDSPWMFSVAVPELAKFTVCSVAVVPRRVGAKETELLLSVAAATPVPVPLMLTTTETGLPAEMARPLAMTLPVRVPVAVGVNVTCPPHGCPRAKVVGQLFVAT